MRFTFVSTSVLNNTNFRSHQWQANQVSQLDARKFSYNYTIIDIVSILRWTQTRHEIHDRIKDGRSSVSIIIIIELGVT